ncbi:MAG TPA: DUF255 domain-containing protein [Bacteroidales bacterium]|jgi:uncharacterized protein YyaL (SSP411 family)|nr:DUF255 domain-containing protein [Bacteroidales bacterium]
MMQYNRNNLDKSASPYLLQHASNPVWWQEWSNNVISYASDSGKLLLVSSGYATCHWCHVMASGAFSDQETASWLNENFVCIKIDREQRPDIDQFLMDFINRQAGSGGWPLNVFMTSSIKPVYALTYAPDKDNESMYSFLSVAKKIHEFYLENSDKIPQFTPVRNKPREISENSLVRVLSDYYDPENGGFGNNHKFPPHSTLLYLLYQLCIDESPSIRTICTKTLDAMMLRGLDDHLQGGIFRYCVDSEWTIPHFEKMLYDQAMALWVYSLAFKITCSEDYKRMAEKILRCIDESFLSDGLYISAHDADTEHHEGETYLWSYDQLAEVLSPAELEKFSEAYEISIKGNFEGKNHLIRKSRVDVSRIEEKLLSARKRRIQPGADEKILSGMNALLAIGMIHASRYLDMPSLEEKAEALIRNIKDVFWTGKSLGHSKFRGMVQPQPFLSDTAALLAAVTLLCETDQSWKSFMEELAGNLKKFREDDAWIESWPLDFPPVFASCFDHPYPSGVSMAESALTRYGLHMGKDELPGEYLEPFQSDFYNLNIMVQKGLFHVFTTHEPLEWKSLPANSVQVRGLHEQDCYMGVCSPLKIGNVT